ncbi:MAG: GTPase ObgE [Chitinispirillaceae bacterium]|nr:GTPase ObgE [Chitinispirillaceae bacterium]
MFIDETTVELIAGDGGNGCHAYERLKYKPRGKPDGGDGGRGGHIYLRGCAQVHTLQDVAYRHRYRAERGAHGKGKNQAGRSGRDFTITVPLGTIVYDAVSGALLLDCLTEGKKELVAQGGRGGRGNAALATRRNPNPERCEAGRPGEAKSVRLVLKLLADVGLVGRPNAGKSTFLSRISRARPKIADYPFTTTKPHLGLVRPRGGGDSFVVADIPGIIEECHTGKGLGIRFLRHIERTGILAILIEATCHDPQADAKVLLNELAHYSGALVGKPRLFILTKKDIIENPAEFHTPPGWHLLSAVTGEGVEEVVRTLHEMVGSSRREALTAEGAGAKLPAESQ